MFRRRHGCKFALLTDLAMPSQPITDFPQYFICPVSTIHHRGRDLDIPMGMEGKGGEYTLMLKQWLKDIMFGVEEHEWAVVVPEIDGML